MIDLDKNLQPGKKIRIFYRPGHRGNRLLHIRAIVDEYIVFKEWYKRKQRWEYSIEHPYFFELRNRDGHLQEVE